MDDLSEELARLGYGVNVNDCDVHRYWKLRHKMHVNSPKHSEAQREKWRAKKQAQRAKGCQTEARHLRDEDTRTELPYWPDEPQRPLYEVEVSRPHGEHSRPVFGCRACKDKAYPVGDAVSSSKG